VFFGKSKVSMKKNKRVASELPTFWEILKTYLLEITIASIAIYFLYWLTLSYIENS
jgi:hypothetical protein